MWWYFYYLSDTNRDYYQFKTYNQKAIPGSAVVLTKHTYTMKTHLLYFLMFLHLFTDLAGSIFYNVLSFVTYCIIKTQYLRIGMVWVFVLLRGLQNL